MNFPPPARNLFGGMTDPLDRIAFRLLILRCQTGDAAAFADLVRQHNDRLAGYLRGLLGRDPADALQDVWLAVWRGLPRLADPEAFAGWAFRIARDRAFAELRRKGFKQVPLDDVAADEPDEVDAAAVWTAVDTLPPLHRDVLLLRYVEGLSYEADRRRGRGAGGHRPQPAVPRQAADAGHSPTGGRDVTEPQETCAAVLARDAWRIRWLTRLTLLLWLMVLATVGTVAGVQYQLISPKQQEMHEMEVKGSAAKAAGDVAGFEQAKQRLIFLAAMVTLAVYYGIAALTLAISLLAAAVAVSLWLTLTARRATLRQIQASLAAIAGQLAEVQQARGTMP